jgi:hypothetical protein
MKGGPVPSSLGKRWMAIAKALQLRVSAPASIILPGGTRINADVLLIDFGAQRGMLLVTDYDLVRPHEDSLLEAGYGFSVLTDPGLSAESLPPSEDVIDALRDWGWAGRPEDEPAWMRDTKDPDRG